MKTHKQIIVVSYYGDGWPKKEKESLCGIEIKVEWHISRLWKNVTCKNCLRKK